MESGETPNDDSRRPRCFSCPFENCGKVYSDQSSLSKHKRQHTGVRKFACRFPDCSRSFYLSAHLSRHERIHTGVRAFVCPVEGCKRSFHRSDELAKHSSVHDGIKRYQCPFPNCGRRYAQRASMTRHISAKHRRGDASTTNIATLEPSTRAGSQVGRTDINHIPSSTSPPVVAPSDLLLPPLPSEGPPTTDGMAAQSEAGTSEIHLSLSEVDPDFFSP